jgi:hypothetical protein
MSQVTQAILTTHHEPADPAPQCPGTARQRHRYSKILLLLFFLTLPLVNPWVRGDGVDYYAYIRSLMVEHKLDFTNDWRSANESFSMGRVRPDGTIDPRQYTPTGYLTNHSSVGPSMLWAPFLLPVHGVILTLRHFGINVQANGLSRPYLVTMALATALYGFLGLLISFRFACLYTGECWAFLATLGIWFASSLPVYMYFNPSWSHAHSVFAVAIFLWYWQRTRQGRTLPQWMVLGLLSGLLIDVYYLNIALLLIPSLESLRQYGRSWLSPERAWGAMGRLFRSNLAYGAMVIVAFLPTLITRQMIYGSPLNLGYAHEWNMMPALLPVLFSSDHGLLTWTPILILAIMGWFFLRKYDQELVSCLFIAFLAFYALVSFHSNWDGLSSYGNRYFISFTPFFILGLAVMMQELAGVVKDNQRALIISSTVTCGLVLWNAAFIFQWGTHMIPVRGPISWKQMAGNQFHAVPQRAVSDIVSYFEDRHALMNHIEQDDVSQWRQQHGVAKSK